MKKYNYIILFMTLLVSCTQKPAEVVQKRGGVYNPSYSEVYVESPDGKIARSLRGNNDSGKAQEVSIINKNAIKETNNSEYGYYTVEGGDSLWSISRKYDMTVPELIAMNDLEKPYNIRPNQKLRVSGNANTETVKVVKKDTYTVQSGDNLSSIANKFDMKTADIAELNDIEKPYNIRVGQKLKVNTTSGSSQTSIVAKQTNGIYTVKSGDNLSSIAAQNDMSLDEIAKLNDIKKPYTLRAGQKLKISKNNVVVAQAAPKQQAMQQKPAVSVQTATQSANRKNSFIWPVKGEVVSSFGNKANGLYNDGINISASKGTNFKASEDGVVAYVGNELRGYGTIVLIKHNDNWISAYAHCGSVKVARGDKVQKGQIIGTVGQSGNVTSPQLYFSLRSGREAVDPIKYLE